MNGTQRPGATVVPGGCALACPEEPPGTAGGRDRAFMLIADGVAAGLAVPWRVSVTRGCQRIRLDVVGRPGWEGWRGFLGCAEVTVRVYQAPGGSIRRSSVARTVRDDGCRIGVRLIEDIDTQSWWRSVWGPGVPG